MDGPADGETWERWFSGIHERETAYAKAKGVLEDAIMGPWGGYDELL